MFARKPFKCFATGLRRERAVSLYEGPIPFCIVRDREESIVQSFQHLRCRHRRRRRVITLASLMV